MKPSSRLGRQPFGPPDSSMLLLAVCLLLTGVSSAAPCITLSKKSGPPTSGILVSGRGFQPNVGVDIYFDTKDEALVVTNSKGEFEHAKAYAPRSAYPGQHWVTALERNNDKGAQKPFLVQTNWSQFHFTADGTRWNPYENVLNSKTARGLSLHWTYTSGHRFFGSPAVVDGIVYIPDWPDQGEQSHLYALAADSGSLIWSFIGNGFDDCPAITKGIVYVGSGTNVLALSADDGHQVWRFQTGDSIGSSAAVSDGVVYIGSGDTNLYALDAHSGTELWRFGTGSFIESSPSVVNGVVYVGSFDHSVYALDARTGAKRWSYATGGIVWSSPAVSNGVVYVGSEDGNLYALNATNGALLWSSIVDEVAWSSPAVADGVVYVGVNATHAPTVYALEARSGDKLWTYTTGNAVVTSPAVANGVVYLGSDDGNVYAFDALNGTLLWSYATGGMVESSPTVADGKVYIGSLDGSVYAFSLTDRNEAGQATSKRPGPKQLRPDFSLEASEPVATGPRH